MLSTVLKHATRVSNDSSKGLNKKSSTISCPTTPYHNRHITIHCQTNPLSRMRLNLTPSVNLTVYHHMQAVELCVRGRGLMEGLTILVLRLCANFLLNAWISHREEKTEKMQKFHQQSTTYHYMYVYIYIYIFIYKIYIPKNVWYFKPTVLRV